MAAITLSDGTVCIVDPEDFERLSQFTWTRQKLRTKEYATLNSERTK